MKNMRELVGSTNGYAYHAEIAATRPSDDYTIRIIPYKEEGSTPLYTSQILWQR
jgi:starch phosphorylase